jgi:lipopolysaccharide transport system permease protein
VALQAKPSEEASVSPAPERPELLILPRAKWVTINFAELWGYRRLVYMLAWRDVKARYKQTLLGASWAILQPLMMSVVFTVFLGHMVKVPSGGLPYPVFVYAGLLPWTFFATALSAAGNSVVASEHLVGKVYFPRLALPSAAVAAAMIDFFIAFGVLVGMMFYYGIRPGPGLALVPLLTLLLALAGHGFGSILGALNVRYRDFRYLIPFLLQLWMFATPSVYTQPSPGPTGQVATSETVARPASTRIQLALELNPMTGLVSTFRAAALGGPVPWRNLATSGGIIVLSWLVGMHYFVRAESSFADLI